MNTKQWTRFFSKDKHSARQLHRASEDASNFYACAAGCKLQNKYAKTEKEMECIPYDVLYSALSDKAYRLAHDFHHYIDKAQGGEPAPEAKEIFETLRDMPMDDFLTR